MDHHHHDHDEDHSHHSTPPGPFKDVALQQAQQDLMMAKVVAMVVLGFVSFFIGVLPVKLAAWFHFGEDLVSGKRKHAHDLVISLLLCFGGGVLLYTTFVHLQPEVRQGFDALQQAGKLPAEDMHLAELTFCAGFFLVYIVEELVHLVLDGRAAAHQEEVVVVHRTMSLRRCPAGEDGHHHYHHHHNIGGPNQMIPRAILAPGVPAKPDASSQPHHPAEAGGVSTRKSMTSSTEGLINGRALGSTASFPAPDQHGHAPGHSHGHLKEKVMSKSISGFLTVLALSFHAVFEGLAVGLESSPSNVWYLFGAVATHKFVIAFCVGVELVTSKTRLSLLLVYVATFAVVSPLGIAVGLLLGTDPAAGESVAAVALQGMAAGTLLYVVFFEILQRERANTQCGVLQLIAIMVGFGVMLALQITSGHNHSHHGVGLGDGHLHHHHHHEDHDDVLVTSSAPAAALRVAEALAASIAA